VLIYSQTWHVHNHLQHDDWLMVQDLYGRHVSPTVFAASTLCVPIHHVLRRRHVEQAMHTRDRPEWMTRPRAITCLYELKNIR
jgi:hypothetical protein